MAAAMDEMESSKTGPRLAQTGRGTENAVAAPNE
jgi:hypothetical protein